MYHYIDKNNTAQGPCSLEELSSLLAKRVLSRTTLIAKLGDKQWTPLGEVLDEYAVDDARVESRREELPSQPSAATGDSEYGTVLLLQGMNRKFEQGILGFYQAGLGGSGQTNVKFQSLLTVFDEYLQRAILAFGLLLAVLCTVVAVKFDLGNFFWAALAVLPVSFILQYIVALFASANRRLLQGPPIKLFTLLVPKALTIVGTTLSVTVVFLGIYLLENTFSRSFKGGMAILHYEIFAIVVLIFFTWMTANCEKTLKVELVAPESQNAADYFCNLIRFFGRLLLGMTPLLGLLAAVFLLFFLLYSSAMLLSAQNLIEALALGAASSVLGVLLAVVLLLPVVTHFTYISFVTISELINGFFRLVDSTQRIADQRQSDKSDL